MTRNLSSTLFIYSRCHLGAYASFAPASDSSGIVVAMSYVSMSRAVLHGAALSLHAAVTLVSSIVALPQGSLQLSGPSYDLPVNLGTASTFALLAASAVTNTASLFHCSRRP
jgi:hypothetical protein